MGNTASCAPSIISNGGGTIKVLFFDDARIRIYTKPVKAIDLMLENPEHFVCESNSLNVGYRIHGLTAEEELERRRLYFLLPVELLYSVLTHEEMSAMKYKASKAVKFVNLGKIFPVCMFPAAGEKRPTESIVGAADNLGEKYVKQRSWKPALETIIETPSRQ